MLICSTCRTVLPPNTASCPKDKGPLQEVTDLPQGAIFDGYRVLRKIGVGGMGKVYEAEHLSLGRRVALKVLLPRYARDQSALRRFLSEAKVVNLIKHQNIVNIYDISTAPSGDFYFVMELLEGEDLAQFLQKNSPLSEEFFLGVFLQISRALWTAHQKGVIHRDLKPANVFLVPRDGGAVAAKLLDFGLAKLQGEGQKGPDKGPLLGTPHYMAPEYIRGAMPTPATDQYAFGVMMYRALTGVRPFEGKDSMEVFRKQLSEVPQDPQLLRPSLRKEFCQIIMRSLQKDPTQRFAHMGELIDALSALSMPTKTPAEPVPSVPPHRSRRLMLGVFVAAMILGVAGAAVLHLATSTEATALNYRVIFSQALESTTPTEKKLAIQTLGEVSFSDSVPVLRSLLKDNDLEVRQAIILALGLQRDPAAKEELQGIWKNTKSLDVAAALLRLGDESAAAFLLASLEDPARRVNAALAFAVVGDHRGDKVLQQALERGLLSPALGLLAAESLLSFGSELGKTTLKSAVAKDDNLSTAAALALARQGDEEARQWLSARAAISFEAVLALASLGDAGALPELLRGLSLSNKKPAAVLAIAKLLSQKSITRTRGLNNALTPLLSDPVPLVRLGASLAFLVSP
jgi:serine/threonine protein kinase